MNKPLTIWIDMVNVSQIQFLFPIQKRFQRAFNLICTTRELAENVAFLQSLGVEFQVIGKHFGKYRLMKAIGVLKRDFYLLTHLPKFDISLSSGSTTALHTSKLRMKKSISFDDNENSLTYKPFYGKAVDYLIMPKAISEKGTLDINLVKNRLIYYGGFKEDVYVADYQTDPEFLNKLPFDDFITVRPEALKAYYVSKEAETIVPQLFSLFSKEDINILYFPRYAEDWDYAKGFDNIYIPPKPLMGLDVCFHSRAVLTGSGTFSREAACLGVPAVSFFPEKQLLAVDQKMVENGWVFHSRSPEEIIEYTLQSKKRSLNLERSKRVQKEVIEILEGIIEEIQS